VKRQWGIKVITLRPRSKRPTPTTTSAFASPTGSRGIRPYGEQSNSETSGARDARAQRRAEGSPSPVQRRARVHFKITQQSYFSQYIFRHHWLRNVAGKYIRNVVSLDSKVLPVPNLRTSYQCIFGNTHTRPKLVPYSK